MARAARSTILPPLALLAIVAAGGAYAQTYPEKPIKLILPAAAGGPTDVPARMLAQMLPKLGQPVIVENRPGAGGAIGARAVASAEPDGHTLLVANTSVMAVIPSVSASAGYDPVTSFTPVVKFMESYQVLVVHPSFPATTVQEFIAYAKAHPGKLNYAHMGAGGLPHLTTELFRLKTGIAMVGVPYKSGGEALTGVLSQQIHMSFEGITIVLPQIRAGKLRALAVLSEARTPLAPDLPTMIESGIPDFVVTTFNGLLAPAGTPAGIVDKLNHAVNEDLKSPDMQAKLTQLGAISVAISPAEFGAFIAQERARWTAVAKAANIRID